MSSTPDGYQIGRDGGLVHDHSQVRAPVGLAPRCTSAPDPRGTPKADQCRREIEELKAAQAPVRMELALQLQRELMALDRQFEPLQAELQRIAKEQRLMVDVWQAPAPPDPYKGSITRHLLHGSRGFFSEVCRLRQVDGRWVVRVATTLDLPARFFEYMMSGTLEEVKGSADRKLRRLGFWLLDTDEGVEQARANW